jgi:hypothetical protein
MTFIDKVAALPDDLRQKRGRYPFEEEKRTLPFN